MSNEEEVDKQSLRQSSDKKQIQTSTIVGNYKLEKTIGEGTFGKVKLAIHLPTQEYVAIKILEKSKIHDQEELERVEKEIKYLKKLLHPNIIQIYEIIENSKNFYLVMEYANGGELFNYIVKNEKLSENEASYFFSQIIHGIEHIHKYKICHRDVKPENLLLTEKKIIKIIDFGLSNEYDKYLSTPCGSPCYASPEMIHGIKYNGLSVDLWASGVILYAMVCGYLPFDDQNNEKLFAKILECKLEFPSEDETVLSPQCKNLIARILTPNPIKRISLDEIKSHPFLAFGNEKYASSVNEDNFTHNDLIIERMINTFDCNRNEIVTALENNRHNNLTTMFKLYKKIYIEGRFYDGLLLKQQPHLTKLSTYHKNTPTSTAETKNKKKIISNKTPNNYIQTNNRSMIDDLDNAISETAAMEKGNIIIINNTNMISQPVKMNPLYSKLITNKNQKPTRKIDTSVSIDKTKRGKDTSVSKPKTPTVSSNKRDNNANTRIRKLNHAKLLAEIAQGNITKRATSDETKIQNTNRIYKSKVSPNKVPASTTHHSIKEATSCDTSTNKSVTNDPYVPNVKKQKHKMNTLNIGNNPNIRLRTKDYSPNHLYNNHNLTAPSSGHSPMKTDINLNQRLYQRKNIPSDIDPNKVSNTIYQKKRNEKDGKLIIFQKPKASNFVLCTSQLSKKEIETKLVDYCKTNMLNIFLETGTHINSRFVISIDTLNKFIIEINAVDDCRMLKLYHHAGQEELTKNVIRKIVVNVGF